METLLTPNKRNKELKMNNAKNIIKNPVNFVILSITLSTVLIDNYFNKNVKIFSESYAFIPIPDFGCGKDAKCKPKQGNGVKDKNTNHA